MDYKELGHIYYSDHELYEIMYKRRFSSIYTHHINFDIREWPAFFCCYARNPGAVEEGRQLEALNLSNT